MNITNSLVRPLSCRQSGIDTKGQTCKSGKQTEKETNIVPLLADGSPDVINVFVQKRSVSPSDAAIETAVLLKRIHTETANYLERLTRSACEGRAIDEANNFLRWLQFSGIIKLTELYDTQSQLARDYEVKGAKRGASCHSTPRFAVGQKETANRPSARVGRLRDLCDDLQDIVKPYLQGWNMRASPSQARVDELNDKVDRILAHLAKPTSGPETAAVLAVSSLAAPYASRGPDSPPGSP